MSDILEPSILQILGKVHKVINELNEILIDRKRIIDLSILALIANENILLLGPPGTAKSLLASEVCKRIENAKYFQRLLTKFSTNTELLVSGQEIHRETLNGNSEITRIKNSHKGMLPECEIAFLDEVFKANSAILNALLTLINERVYYTNDGKEIKSSLISVFGASNERPKPEEGLEALYDRFLIRYYIGYLQDRDDFIKMLSLEKNNNTKITKITINDIYTLNGYLDKIEIPNDILETIYRKKEILKKSQELKLINPSDRRWRNSLKILRAHALLKGRGAVITTDIMETFPYILWDTQPGMSTNLNYDKLEELEMFFRKSVSLNLDEMMKNLEKLKTKLKELQHTEETIRQEIHSNQPDKYEKNINDYDLEGTKFIAQVEEYKKRAEDFNPDTLPLGEQEWLKGFGLQTEKFKTHVKNKIREHNDYLMQ